jgi:hypothetical protein
MIRKEEVTTMSSKQLTRDALTREACAMTTEQIVIVGAINTVMDKIALVEMIAVAVVTEIKLKLLVTTLTAVTPIVVHLLVIVLRVQHCILIWTLKSKDATAVIVSSLKTERLVLARLIISQSYLLRPRRKNKNPLPIASDLQGRLHHPLSHINIFTRHKPIMM